MGDENNPYRGPDAKPLLRPSVVAFVDILGYKDYIKTAFEKGEAQVELSRLRNALDEAYLHLKDAARERSIEGKASFAVRTFTDNLLIAYPVNEQAGSWSALMMVFTYLEHLQMQLARQGYFVRGAISVGDLYADEDIVFGPALLEAYESEGKDAMSPRIILGDSAEKSLREHCIEYQVTKVPDVLIDSDNRVFVDYLENNVMIAFPDDGPFFDWLEDHKCAVVAKLKEFGTIPRIRQKYEWVAAYHNAFCDTYPEHFDESHKVPISVLYPKPAPWMVARQSDNAPET